MRRLFLVLMLVLAAPPLRAAAEAGQPGGYLRAGVGARAAAMGNAFVALAEGAEAAYWNPAGLAWGREPALASSFNVLSLGRRFNAAELLLAFDPDSQPPPTGSFPMAMNHGLGAWGVGWLNFSLGNDFEGRSADTASFYTFGDRQDTYTLAHGRAIFPWLALGAGLKLYDRVIDIYEAHGQGMDLGALLLLGPQVRLGIAAHDLFSNFVWSTGYEEKFPVMVQTSLAASFWKDRLVAAGQVQSVEGRQLQFGAGIEGILLGFIRGRVGVNTDGLTFGGGLRVPLGRMTGLLDYAYLPDPLKQGDSQRISVELRF